MNSAIAKIAVLLLAFFGVCSAAGEGPLSYQTKVVHAGCEPENSAWAVVPQISLATTFTMPYPGVRPGVDDPNSHGGGYYYSRHANPTRGALERALATVENGKAAAVFSSGMAAIHNVIQTLESGDHVIALDDLYGGTTSLFSKVVTPVNGIKFTFMNLDDIKAVEAAITPKTKMIYLESPTNPLLKSTNIRAIVQLAKRKGLLVAVDNTFMSPYLQKPLDLGADISIHSITKYIGGHSDVLMGAVITNSDVIINKLRNLQNLGGAVPSPFECYLALRGLKTLHVRMDAAMKNAQAVAEFLQSHPMIERVVYPGLPSYAQYELAKSQTSGPGAMISIYVKGGLKGAGKFLAELKVFGLAVSLGATESLACSPAIMTHAAVPVEAREAIGLTDSLVRISIGIEHSQDLINDLRQALDKAGAFIAAEGNK